MEISNNVLIGIIIAAVIIVAIIAVVGYFWMGKQDSSESFVPVNIFKSPESRYVSSLIQHSQTPVQKSYSFNNS